MKLPNHYRKLKEDEVIRKGDFYISTNDASIIGTAKRSVGRLVSEYKTDYPVYDFYRRRHVKAQSTLKIIVKGDKAAVVEKRPVNVTVVRFRYKGCPRRVQVIKFDDHYLTGLEITPGENNKPNYQFKNFLRRRMESAVVLENFKSVYK
jgi:hypothetical protein